MKTIKPFDHNYFLGYVNKVTPQFIKIHFPSSNLLENFYHKGSNYAGGNVGNFIVIEGEEYGFLARITKTELPDAEKKLMTEKAIKSNETAFHPAGEAELLLCFDIFEPKKTKKTISKYPAIGAKVYSCSNAQIAEYVKAFGTNNDDVYADLGKLTTNDVECKISLNSLFSQHCAIVGTTGSGKSWTVAKLVEEIIDKTTNKIILIDATGEYLKLEGDRYILTKGTIFPYEELTIDDLFILLRPTGQSQKPILIEAIRSLKLQKILKQNEQNKQNGCFKKANQSKEDFNKLYQENIEKIEDGKCDFNIQHLAEQIKEECVYPSDTRSGGFNEKFGGFNEKVYDHQITLINRINNLINNENFNNVFHFRKLEKIKEPDSKHLLILEKIKEFLKKSDSDTKLLHISFEHIPSSFQIKEIVANALASFLLNSARDGELKTNPTILIVDEAHQFLNKKIKDEFFEAKPLDSFDIISKECRKYGLFLCLATQMPKDIPVGTLSQMGTFIVHRLINEDDKKVIADACSSANRNDLLFLPILGAGEAILAGVDFCMPLLIKINQPNNEPNSNTPKLTSKKINNGTVEFQICFNFLLVLRRNFGYF